MTNTTTKKAHKTKGSSSLATKEQIVFTGQDKVIHDLVHAPSNEIDAIAANLIIRDTEFIIEYFKQRINLEQKYLDGLSTMTKNIQACCKPSEHNLIQSSFMKFVGLADEQRPAKQDFIETLKQQCEGLMKFRNEQQKAFDKNKAWMHQSNTEYLVARLKKLPKMHEVYVQKWDEIERSNGTSIASPMMAPLTPVMSTDSSMAGSLIHKQLSIKDEESDMRAMSMDDDRARFPKYNDQSSRIERFMKKRLNKPEDPTRQNIKLAKLKVEVAEADKEYRNAVREVSTLSIKIDATNHHILNNVQTALKERSEKVKQMLQVALDADLMQSQERQAPISHLMSTVQHIDIDRETKLFNNHSTSALKNFKKPVPIYYYNHHVGLCKDLIFGTSLTEYAQQRGRSPPLLITKCIEAIERLGGIEKEGIYRVSGKQSNMEKIKHAFELDEEAVVIGQNDVPEDVVSISSVIKIFLRELKSPLFPFKLTDRLVYSQIPDQELRLMNLLTRLLKLEPANYDTLKVLVHHLKKLQSSVEKNKMTINNLTLIFTPAIFQDLNHAQSPGEWAKDCVLEDLIINADDIFANKDLHNNSAITGHIEYGFHQHDVDSNDMLANRYAMTIQSPDSPTMKMNTEEEEEEEEDEGEDDYEFSVEAYEYEDDDYSSYLPDEQNNTHLSASQLPLRNSSRSPSPTPISSVSTPHHFSDAGNNEKKKYQAHFQGKGLTVDTGSITSSVSSSRVPSATDNKRAEPRYPTAIKSATVPSYDWLKQDPENRNPPAVPKLRRSATADRKALSKRVMNHADSDVVPRVPLMSRSKSNTTVHVGATHF
ncbi:hypothetical protein BD560DRAFT_393091 [Blakeslea trispora]|nr:hypothetical protein BD560DRAFT_393091 [Blakeslea trispora]